MSANSDDLGYWTRGGTTLLPASPGKVASTGTFDYWTRGGSVLYPFLATGAKPAVTPSDAVGITATLGGSGIGHSRSLNDTVGVTGSLSSPINTWTYYRKLTINGFSSPRYVGTTDLASFPVAVTGTFSYLALANLSGNTVTVNSVTYPSDIAFYLNAPVPNSAKQVPLPFEIVSYDSSTGTIEAWVQVPTLYGSSNGGHLDTVFYMAYKNPSQTTDLSGYRAGGTKPWDANFLGVWHLQDVNTTGASVRDSAGTNTGTPSVSKPTNISGQIGGAGSFAAASSQEIQAGTAINPGTLSLSGWVKPGAIPGGGAQVYQGTLGRDNGTQYSAILVGNTSGVLHLATYVFAGSSIGVDPGSATLSIGTWYHIAMTYDSVGGLKTYVNGVSDGVAGANGALNTTAATFRIGNDAFASRFLNGAMDEARASNSVRTIDWFKAEYGNGSNIFASVSGQTISSPVGFGLSTDIANGVDSAIRVAMRYVRSCTESAAGTDVATGPLRIAVDVARGTDTATQIHSLTRPGSDVANGTDVATERSNRAFLTASDYAGGMDVAQRMFRRTASDSASGQELSAPTRIRNFLRYAINPSGFALLMENGFYLLKEDGGKLLLDGSEVYDNAGGTDVAIRTKIAFHPALADTVGITETVGGRLRLLGGPADTVGITETVTGQFGTTRSLADAVGITETVAGKLVFLRSFTNAVGITDALAIHSVLHLNFTDTVGVTDTVAGLSTRARALADTVGITDVLAGQRGLHISIADAVGITDTLTQRLVFLRSISDTVGITDSLAIHNVRLQAISDTVGVTETINGRLVFLRSCTDTVGITDTISTLRLINVAISDTVGITETVAGHSVRVRAIADTIGITDLLSDRLIFTVNLPDTIGITETLARHLVFLRSFGDTVGIADVVEFHPVAGLNDTYGIAGTLTSHATYHRSFTDIVGVTDLLVRVLILHASLGDTVGITDLLKLSSFHAALADTVGIVDALARHLSSHFSFTDLVGITDSLGREVIAVSLSETVGFADSLTIEISLNLPDLVQPLSVIVMSDGKNAVFLSENGITNVTLSDSGVKDAPVLNSGKTLVGVNAG